MAYKGSQVVLVAAATSSSASPSCCSVVTTLAIGNALLSDRVVVRTIKLAKKVDSGTAGKASKTPKQPQSVVSANELRQQTIVSKALSSIRDAVAM